MEYKVIDENNYAYMSAILTHMGMEGWILMAPVQLVQTGSETHYVATMMRSEEDNEHEVTSG